MKRLKKFWDDHSILVILFWMLVLFLVASFFLGQPEWIEEQKHAKASTALWPGYWIHWGYDVIVSMLADVWGPLLLIALGIRWWDRKSKESGSP